MRKSFIAAAVSLGALSACTMAPDLPQLNLPLPEHFPSAAPYDEKLVRQAAQGERDATLSEIAWQHYFEDADLKALIEQGLSQNRSLKQAALDIAEARALYGIERSAYFPEITADGGYNKLSFPEGGFAPGAQAGQAVGAGGGGPIEFYTASVGMTAYELDVFGRVQSLNDAALNRFLASQAAQEVVRISLIADIAGAYTTFKADQALLALAESTINAQKEALNLIKLRVDEGVSSNLELSQAQILLEQATADKIALERAIAQDKNALRLLLGTPAELPALKANATVTALDAIAPVVPIGLPSELLLVRPDLQQAEYVLSAANADIGAARAAFFPRITLTGSAGYQSPELDGLFDPANEFWQFSPSISIPIFTFGRLSNNLELSEIRTDKAVIAYEQTIETAFREVADALVSVSTYDDQMHAQGRLINASAEATTLSELRYNEGVESYLSVLDDRRELYNAQQAYLRLKAEEVASRIGLYKAVGGGRGQGISDAEQKKPCRSC